MFRERWNYLALSDGRCRDSKVGKMLLLFLEQKPGTRRKSIIHSHLGLGLSSNSRCTRIIEERAELLKTSIERPLG